MQIIGSEDGMIHYQKLHGEVPLKLQFQKNFMIFRPNFNFNSNVFVFLIILFVIQIVERIIGKKLDYFTIVI